MSINFLDPVTNYGTVQSRVNANFAALKAYMEDLTGLDPQVIADFQDVLNDFQDTQDATDTGVADAIENGTLTPAALDANYGRAVSLPPSNGTADAAVINNLIENNPGAHIIGRRGQTYVLEQAIVVNSGTTLDVSGCIMQRKTGTTGMLIRNAAFNDPEKPRDTNITVIGGTWDKNSTSGGSSSHGLHFMVFHRVDGITVRDATYVDASNLSKYALLFADVTSYRADNLTFDDIPSDGVHVIGPAVGGSISRLYGKTGDDFVSFTPVDYSTYTLTGGNIHDCVVEKIFPDGAASGILLNGGNDGVNPTSTTKITIRDYYGIIGNGYPIRITDDANSPTTVGGVVDDITIENVGVTNSSGYIVFFNLTTEGRVAGGYMGAFKLRNIQMQSALDKIRINAIVQSIVIDGIVSAAEHATSMVHVTTDGEVNRLTVRDVTATLKTDKSAGQVVQNQGIINRLTVDDAYVRNGTATCLLQGATTRLHANNWDYTSALGISVTADSEAPTVTGSDITATAPFVYVSGSSASAVVQGYGVAPTAVDRSGTQTIRANGPSLRADVGKLTPIAGDIVFNTNAGAGPAGPVAWNGSAWTTLYGA